MTIKDIAAAAGLSHQAIYKRLKARGVKLESIKIKGTGELTAEGEALMREIFNSCGEALHAREGRRLERHPQGIFHRGAICA